MSSFTSILNRMLKSVPQNRDKRQGSIIYDTLAPTAAELANMHITHSIFKEQTYLLTAAGENLDKRAADFGISRLPATRAVRVAEMTDTDGNPVVLPLGSRFAAPNTSGGLTFILTEHLEQPGRCLLTCETEGPAGNAYQGALLPLFAINNLRGAVITGTYISARGIETDADLRSRLLERINRKAYGGNIADYKQFTKAITGVGDVKVFPVWNGGGTVLLSVVDSDLRAVSADFIQLVQTAVDPVPNSGEGLGIAPIGHRVTVTTPGEVSVNITAGVVLKTGFTVSQLQRQADDAIEAYLLELRREWSEAAVLSVFTARAAAAIIGIDGINNITNLKINGSPEDLRLTQTAASQFMPVFGSVVLSVA